MDINDQIRVEYYNQFLREIEAVKSYLIKCEEDGSMKSKIYTDDCAIKVQIDGQLFLS